MPLTALDLLAGIVAPNGVELDRLPAAITAEDSMALSEKDAQLNLAYRVVHEFRLTPARIIRPPLLLERAYSPSLGKRLMPLRYGDASRAALARRPLLLGPAIGRALLAR